VRDRDKSAIVELAHTLVRAGFELVATRGTAVALAGAGLPVVEVKKVHEGRPHIVDLIKDRGIGLVINTTDGRQAIRDSYSLRRAALMAKLPYYTTLPGARAAVQALERLVGGELEVAPLQSYFSAPE
jgi:carbamoyl-phosphate synthase large subunit